MAYNVYVKGDPATGTLLDCPFCHRVLLTLENKHVPYENEYIDFKNKPAWLLEKSAGKVPVIQKDDFWLHDSDKIVEYLEQQHPQPSMASSVPAEVSANFFPLFKGWLFAEEGELEEKKAAFLEQFKKVDEYLSSHKGPFFGGDHLDATDAALAPKLYHAAVALGHYRGFSLDDFPAVAQYMEAIKQHPAWKACDYGEQAIIKGWPHKH